MPTFWWNPLHAVSHHPAPHSDTAPRCLNPCCFFHRTLNSSSAPSDLEKNKNKGEKNKTSTSQTDLAMATADDQVIDSAMLVPRNFFKFRTKIFRMLFSNNSNLFFFFLYLCFPPYWGLNNVGTWRTRDRCYAQPLALLRAAPAAPSLSRLG